MQTRLDLVLFVGGSRIDDLLSDTSGLNPLFAYAVKISFHSKNTTAFTVVLLQPLFWRDLKWVRTAEFPRSVHAFSMIANLAVMIGRQNL